MLKRSLGRAFWPAVASALLLASAASAQARGGGQVTLLRVVR